MAKLWPAGADTLKRDVEDAANDLVSKTDAIAEEARIGMQKALRSIESAVRRYPIQSVLVGFGVGLLLTLGRAKPRKH